MFIAANAMLVQALVLSSAQLLAPKEQHRSQLATSCLPAPPTKSCEPRGGVSEW